MTLAKRKKKKSAFVRKEKSKVQDDHIYKFAIQLFNRCHLFVLTSIRVISVALDSLRRVLHSSGNGHYVTQL